MNAHALLFPYVDGKFFLVSDVHAVCSLQRVASVSSDVLLCATSIAIRSRVFSCHDSLAAGSFARHFKTFSLPDVAQHGGFRAPSWSPSFEELRMGCLSGNGNGSPG